MKKICFIKYDMTGKSGGERVCALLSSALAEFYEVHVVSITGAGETPYFALSDKVTYKAFLEGHGRFRQTALSGTKALRKYLKDNEIGAALSVGGNVNFFLWGATCKTKTRAIFCEHLNLKMASKSRSDAMLRKLGAKIADKIVTLTETDRRDYIKAFSLPAEKTLCIHNWVDEKLLAEEPCYNADSKKIISVGRLETQKDYPAMVKTAKMVLSEHPDWSWDIYGDGEEQDAIQSLIDENGLSGRLCLKGAVSDIYERYKDYAIYVMTSKLEGLPMVLLEAKANGLPAVSFDCPTGPGEIIRDSIDGYLAEPGDCAALAGKISELIHDDKKRLEFSKNAPGNLNKFEKEKILNQWKHLFDSLT